MRNKTGIVPKFNVFDVMMYAAVGLFALATFYPLIYVLAGSLSDARELMYGPAFLFPRNFNINSYRVLLSDSRLFRAAWNTISSMVVTVVVHLFVTSGVAYALASKRLKGRKIFWFFNIVTMFISGGLIPFYIVILQTGLFNTFWVYIVPAVYSVFNMIILSNFFRNLDDEMYESAVMDGAGEYRIWLQIFVPLAKPAIATVALWVAVSRWNAFMPTLLFTDRSEGIWLLQFYLMRLIRHEQLPPDRGANFEMISAQTLSFAAIIITSVPILILFPFVTRFFTKGIMLGSIKG